jgi:hypothetical protein
VRVNVRKILLLTSMVIGLSVAGCSGDDEGGSGGANGDPNCFDYSSFTAADVSLSADVMPIFQNSCTFSNGCHGAETGSAGHSYLGPAANSTPTPEQLQAVIDQNVGAAAKAESGMSRVAAGDAANSFLMHKVDNTLECGDLACAADGSCGKSMPLGGASIAAADANKIRSWIQQGAKNN